MYRDDMTHKRWEMHFVLYELFDYYSRINHHRVMGEHFFARDSGVAAEVYRNMRDLMSEKATQYFNWSLDRVQIPQWSKTIQDDIDEHKWDFASGDPWFEDTGERPAVKIVSKEEFSEEITQSYISAALGENGRRIHVLIESARANCQETLEPHEPLEVASVVSPDS